MVFTQKFQWFFDMSTSPETMQVITVKAGGENVKRRLLPFFQAFKYYKLGAVDVKLVPASTLPVDPTGLSLEAGEATVDPRDQFNPGLVRITNGEDFWFSGANAANTEDAMNVFYTLMLDPRWFKFQLQSGMERSARPKFWEVGQLHQDAFPGAVRNIPVLDEDNHFDGVQAVNDFVVAGQTFPTLLGAGSDPRGLFQTGQKEFMSWLPTDCLLIQPESVEPSLVLGAEPKLAPVPEVELMRIILPKAYKTKYFYRVYVTETVYFGEPVVMNALPNSAGAYMPVNGMDRFVGANFTARMAGNIGYSKVDTDLNNNGGNTVDGSGGD